MSRVDFSGLTSLQVERVRQINRSPIHGRPLRWPGDGRWGDMIPAMLSGWSSGLLLIAGQSNHGKSSLAISLALDLVYSNPHLWVLDFSLDDDVRDRISKYVAILSGLSPESVKMEHHYLETLTDPAALKCYQQALEHGYQVLSDLRRLIVLDSQTMYAVLGKDSDVDRRVGLILPSMENIMLIIMTLYHHLREVDPEGEVLVVLDALNDVVVGDSLNIGENERLSRIGSSIMSASQLWGIRFLATAHARKVTNWRKPSMDDVYGASALKYVAKVITFVYNDYKSKRHESPLTMDAAPYDSVRAFWDALPESSRQRIMPVLVWSFLKVKTSGLDGNTFLALNPYTTGVEPVSQSDWGYYESLLASSDR